MSIPKDDVISDLPTELFKGALGRQPPEPLEGARPDSYDFRLKSALRRPTASGAGVLQLHQIVESPYGHMGIDY